MKFECQKKWVGIQVVFKPNNFYKVCICRIYGFIFRLIQKIGMSLTCEGAAYLTGPQEELTVSVNWQKRHLAVGRCHCLLLQQANVAHLDAVRKLMTWWNKRPFKKATVQGKYTNTNTTVLVNVRITDKLLPIKGYGVSSCFEHTHNL